MCRHPARATVWLGLGALAYPIGALVGTLLGRRHLIHPG